MDRSKCMKMALFHDLAESVIGDIPTLAKVPKGRHLEQFPPGASKGLTDTRTKV